MGKYWPAYMLRDWTQERAGRVKKQKNQKHPTPKKATTDSSSSTNGDIPRNISDLRLSDRLETNHGSSPMPGLAISECDDGSSTFSVSSSIQRQKTVGLLIIGDEIMKGTKSDTNSQIA